MAQCTIGKATASIASKLLPSLYRQRNGKYWNIVSEDTMRFHPSIHFTVLCFLMCGMSVAVHAQNSSDNRNSSSPSVFDRPNNPNDDDNFIVVPAGQEIRVEPLSPENSAPTSAITYGKVVLPVRVGFATAIEPLAKVQIRYAGTTDYGTVYRLVGVEIDKKIYRTKTDLVPYAMEMRFTLTKPLRIHR